MNPGDTDTLPAAAVDGRARNEGGYFSISNLAALGVYLFAFSWPLGAYQRVFAALHLYHIALIPIFLCLFLDLKKNKRLRVPFELAWPAVLIAVAICILPLAGYAVVPWRYAGACFVFIAVAHVVRNRMMALRAMQLCVISGSAMMFLSVLARLNLVYPTAWSLDSGLVMAGPYMVREGVSVAVYCLLLIPALFAATRKNEYRPCRLGFAAWAALPVLLIVYFSMNPRVDFYLLRPWHGLFLYPSVVLMVLLLWGVARITAKLWVARKFMAPGVYLWLAGALLAGIIFALYLTPSPDAGVAFLLALIAGYAQPYVTPVGDGRPLKYLGTLTTAVVILNMALVLPGDPRDYERFAKTALAQGNPNAALEHLAFVKAIAPQETRADYYIARTHLAQDNLDAAYQAFSRSLRPTKPRLLPAPDEALVTEFLNEMREKSSALPERLRGLAYEQALIAAGRERHALSLLELRGEPQQLAVMSARPLAAALAAMLDEASLVETLTQWDASLLAAVLESAGPFNEVAVAPEGFPDSMLPLVVMVQSSPESDVVLVFSPAGHTGGVRLPDVSTPAFMDFAMMLSEPGWRAWRQNANGIWTLAYGNMVEVLISNTPQVLFGVYPAPPDTLPKGFWETRIYVPAQERP